MKFFVKAFEIIITIGALAVLIWVIAALYATFHEAKGESEVMRAHRCWYLELCE